MRRRRSNAFMKSSTPVWETKALTLSCLLLPPAALTVRPALPSRCAEHEKWLRLFEAFCKVAPPAGADSKSPPPGAVAAGGGALAIHADTEQGLRDSTSLIEHNQLLRRAFDTAVRAALSPLPGAYELKETAEAI